VTEPHPGTAYFEQVGDHMREAYLRYSFTKGTKQEVSFLLELLGLPPEARILDVGCGAGRHAILLAQAGLRVTGIDISEGLLSVARDRANELGLGGDRLALFHVDAREMPFDSEFDAVISLCEGAFGLMGAHDTLVLRRMMEAALPGGRVVLTAMNAYCELEKHEIEGELDADTGVLHERTTIMSPKGEEREVDLWVGVYTPRELRLLSVGVGLVPEHVWAADPGDYSRRPPDTDRPELMLVARRPSKTPR
jgi:cyclopropane fatty-acyl-phospholipid synthase-like methyltransferase